jgi:hypothetical protein
VTRQFDPEMAFWWMVSPICTFFWLVIFRVAAEADKSMESSEVLQGSTVFPLKKPTLPTVNCLVQDAHTLFPLQ